MIALVGYFKLGVYDHLGRLYQLAIALAFEGVR
jgi:hypothetical protein